MKNNGYIDFSSKDTMLNDSTFIIKNDINVSEITKIGRNSTMFYDSGYLYVATYNDNPMDDGQVVKFKIDKDSFEYPTIEAGKIVKGSLKSEIEGIYTIPDMTQGIAYKKYKGQDYIITSQSYSDKDSLITVQKITPYGLVDVGVKILPRPGVESLHINSNNELICAFEKGEACVTKISMDDLFNDLLYKYDEKVVSIRNSQIEFSQAGNAKDVVKDKVNDMWSISSSDGSGKSSVSAFFTEYSDYAGSDGVVGAAKGLWDALGDTIVDYQEVAFDSYAVIEHSFKSKFS